jgi:predicted amino acid-binding ACT domain protein
MPQESVEYIISITSRDRIGIVYEISNAISALRGNIADSRQSVMCGYYTMILRTSFPFQVSQDAIEQKLAEVEAHSGSAINAVVNPIEKPLPTSTDPKYNYVLTATGPDHIGFVATVASFCVQHQINILDLSTTPSNGEFVMILVVDLSRCDSIRELRQSLAEFTSEKNLKIVLQHQDIFNAINEISMPIRPNLEK